ncbi:MAG: PDZ domain-containing protein [Acidimicrobiia bacterium]
MDTPGIDVVPPDEAPADDGDGRWRDVPPSLRPTRKLPRWPFLVGGVLLTVAIAIVIAWPINVPYFALSPGPVNDVGDFVEVEDRDGEDSGELFFLTVSLKEVNALEALWGWFDSEVDLTPRENIRPRGVSQEDLRRQNLAQMDVSKQTAIVVALTRLGFEVTFKGNGSLIISVVEGSAADGLLEANDVIVGVNGSPVEFSDDAAGLIGGSAPGDMVVLDVRRPTDESATEFEDLQIEVTLGVFIGEDADGNEVMDEDRGMVGVLLDNFNVETVLPVDIVIDSQNIGGPSAGMMFTLEIMNQLTDDDLTRGHIIAGTGTIDRDGSVGAIGGVRQKVFGAIDAGAEFVLVPQANFDDASDAAGDDIQVVSIATIDDALAFLDTI